MAHGCIVELDVAKAKNPGPVRFEGDAVRLSVTYKSPSALLSEFTRSVGKGGVSIASRKSVPVGTRFVFELKARACPTWSRCTEKWCR